MNIAIGFFFVLSLVLFVAALRSEPWSTEGHLYVAAAYVAQGAAWLLWGIRELMR